MGSLDGVTSRRADFLDIEQVFDYRNSRSWNTIVVIRDIKSVTGARYVTGTSKKETT